MNKTSYILVDEEYRNYRPAEHCRHAVNGKCAVIYKWGNSNNLKSLFEGYAGRVGVEMVSANICDTKKEACEVAEAWNARYKEEGCYAWD